MKKYEAQSFESLVGLTGFSDTLLQNHFKLYAGYVTNTNALLEKMGTTAAGTPEFAELRRRFGWEFNGMRLHELYFGNLTKTPTTLSDGALKETIVAQWGSVDAWSAEFKAMGTMRGIGWVVLYHDAVSGNLVNTWIAEHDGGHLTGATPLLVMDVFEHAFLTDYGLNRADYVTACMHALDWTVAVARFTK